MATTCLTIDLNKITSNTRKTLATCRSLGLEVVGVTKGVCGLPQVAQAMLAGGIEILGDARLDNIARMRKSGINTPMVLLRSPAPSEVSQCVALTDASLNADLNVLRLLSKESIKMGKRHKVILMMDLDTGREGLAPETVPGVCCKVQAMEGLSLEGLGIYFPYRGEDSFHMSAQQHLVALAREIEGEYGFKLHVISGGSTNIFHSLTLEGKNVKGINQLRIGTAILLGISSSIGPVLIKDFHHDTFVLDAELIEVKQRDRLYGILSIGRMDTEPEYLFPISPDVAVIDASSDHLIVDFTGSAETYRVGDRIAFQLGYFAVSRLTASPYVRIEYR